MSLDEQIRVRAFEWLSAEVRAHGDVLPRERLAKGFEFEGDRIPLLGPQGIFKPRLLDIPLSITTAPDGPYDDMMGREGLLQYRYRGSDPGHRDNVGLRKAMVQHIPLIYFRGLAPGRYFAAWPVLIVGDDPPSLTFTVAVDEVTAARFGAGEAETDALKDVRRAYVTQLVLKRIHQRAFREQVLIAYSTQCAFCRLRHYELLDAAHIIGDREPAGLPKVTNGISLCKLHHAAFDTDILGVTTEYRVEVRADVLDEDDGPMLQHGLKELHGSKLILPRNKLAWPDRDGLDLRYQRFRFAS